ncbi:MAG: c-type cytochrome [Candidatus Dadabacteria bacterium]
MRFFISALAAGCLLSCTNSDKSLVAGKTSIDNVRNLETQELAKRGEYLVIVGGCDDCHSPKVMGPQGPEVDSARRLSGHPANSTTPPVSGTPNKPGNWMNIAPDLTAWIGPWGISYTANLTPDTATGTGSWTAEEFINTIRSGKHLGMNNGRPLLPPMPWQNYRQMNDEDLRSIYTFIHSLPPVNNKVPAPVPPDQVMAK